MRADFEIIIVGAGPAGLSTGLHLAQLAPELVRRTLILEQAVHPRPKLCAGGVVPSGERYLRRLGLDIGAVSSVPVGEVTLIYQGRRSTIRHDPACFRVVRREDFDAWLADAARQRGLELQERTRVQGVQVEHDLAVVKTDRGDFAARGVVGADGAKSVVRRLVAGRQRPHDAQLARVLEVHLPSGRQSDTAGQGHALFDFSWMASGVQGYVWDFPSPANGQSMRTWGVYDSRVDPRPPVRSLRPALETALTRIGRSLQEVKLEGHPFRWFGPQTPLSIPHVLLVGDAAGADPVVGEGISFALGYGEVAAAALRDAASRNDFSFSQYRQRVLQHRIGRYLRRRSLVARLVYHIHSPAFFRFVWPLVGPLVDRLLIDWGKGG
jgi:flavin-dependent dehydrogenase